MDLETLFYIAIAALYLLSRLGGKKKKQQAPAKPGPARRPQVDRPAAQPETSRSAELDDALREIRAALGWDPEPAPTPPPAPPPPPVQPPMHWESEHKAPEWRAPAETVSESARWDEGRPAAASRRLEPTAVPRPVATQAVTRPRPPAIPAQPIETGTSLALTKGLPSIDALHDSEQNARVDQIRKLLRDPSSARDAFLLTEIFARRGGR